MVTIGVIMTCFNRKEKTLNCLEALYRQRGIDKEFTLSIYLVDDGSTDGTSSAVGDSFPSVNVIKGTGNLYWNRGMHLAWENASREKCDYFLWVNDDTKLFDNAIKIFLQAADLTNDNSIICGATCEASDRSFTYGGREKNGKEIVPNGMVQNCYTMNGNAVLVSGNIFKSIGNLNPIFPHAIGDFEYGLRAQKKGFYVVTTPEYIGYCSRNPKLPLWCYQSTPIRKRFKALYSPLGNAHPYYFFIFEKKYYGLLIALKHYFAIHLRTLIPSLWK